jgi:hypothetical protein
VGHAPLTTLPVQIGEMAQIPFEASSLLSFNGSASSPNFLIFRNKDSRAIHIIDAACVLLPLVSFNTS